MKKIAGLVLVAVGGILLWQGWQIKQSVGSRFTESLTGSMPDQALYYLIGGAVAVVVGLGMAVMRSR